MKYPGTELDSFDKATIWRKYIYSKVKKFIKGDVLEVGAGIGSFTKNYEKLIRKLTLSEIDPDNLTIIKKKFSNPKFSFTNKFTKDLEENFDTIMYLNVLEHIEDDIEEINNALKKLKKNGHLIILVPAHNNLYSKFDEAVGHFKRYEIDFFKQIKIQNLKRQKLIYLDSMGYFLYYLNKLFFKEEIYPSNFKILIWDKLFTPITFIVDRLLMYKFGKNILYVVQKL